MSKGVIIALGLGAVAVAVFAASSSGSGRGVTPEGVARDPGEGHGYDYKPGQKPEGDHDYDEGGPLSRDSGVRPDGKWRGPTAGVPGDPEWYVGRSCTMLNASTRDSLGLVCVRVSPGGGYELRLESAVKNDPNCIRVDVPGALSKGDPEWICKPAKQEDLLPKERMP